MEIDSELSPVIVSQELLNSVIGPSDVLVEMKTTEIQEPQSNCENYDTCELADSDMEKGYSYSNSSSDVQERNEEENGNTSPPAVATTSHSISEKSHSIFRKNELKRPFSISSALAKTKKGNPVRSRRTNVKCLSFNQVIQYFTEVPSTEEKAGQTGGKKYYCLYCKTVKTGYQKQTSNFLRHLRNSHKIEPETIDIQNGGQKTLDDLKTETLVVPLNSTKQKLFDQAILDVVAVDGMPFSMVEGLAFKRLMKIVSPQTTLHSRRTIKRHLDNKISTIRECLKTEIQSQPHKTVNLIVDLWTTKDNFSVIGVKAQYINNVYEIVNKTIGFEEFKNSHSGANIEKHVLEVASKVGLQTSQIGFVVADNAANMMKAFKTQFILQDSGSSAVSNESDTDDDSELEDNNDDDYMPTDCPILIGNWNRIGCVAHLLQLAINGAIKKYREVSQMILYAHQIVKFFHRRPTYMTKLRDKCNGLGLPNIGATRWNAVLLALERLTDEKINMFFHAQQLVLEYSASTAGKFNLEQPKHLDRTKILEVVSLLKHWQITTDELQGDYVTSSMAIPCLIKLFTDTKDTECKFYESFKRDLLNNLKERFEENVINKEAFIVATILDPRIKLSVFVGCEKHQENIEYYFDRKKDKVVRLNVPTENCAKTIFDAYVAKEISDSGKANRKCSTSKGKTLIPSNTKSCTGNNLFTFFLNISEDRNSNLNTECEQYLFHEDNCNSETNPLQFWQSKKKLFPITSKLAKQYLGMPASSGSVERLFSVAGSLKRHKRNRLKISTVSNILTYSDNRASKLEMEDKE